MVHASPPSDSLSNMYSPSRTQSRRCRCRPIACVCPSSTKILVTPLSADVWSSTLLRFCSTVDSYCTCDCNPGNGLVVESYLGHIEIKNSRFLDNYGNGVKAKFLDGRFVIVDQLLTFCKMATIGTFPQLITGIPELSRSCSRV